MTAKLHVLTFIWTFCDLWMTLKYEKSKQNSEFKAHYYTQMYYKPNVLVQLVSQYIHH